MLLGVRDAELGGERLDSPPARSLTGAVLGYRAFHEVAAQDRDRWETPSGEIVLVLGLADPFVADGRALTSFVAGLHEQPIHTVYRGVQSGIQIRLDPLAAARIVGVPMHELANRIVGWQPPPLPDGSWQKRFAALDAYFAARLRDSAEPPSQVRHAWQMLRRTGGNAHVDLLVAEAGCSHRHLVGLFRRTIGLPPKRVARLLRYQAAARRLLDGTAGPAVAAAECGYTDQPHLNRDFRRFAGVTPGQISPRR